MGQNWIQEFNPFKSGFILSTDFKTLVFYAHSLPRIILRLGGMAILPYIYMFLHRSYTLQKLSHLILRDTKKFRKL